MSRKTSPQVMVAAPRMAQEHGPVDTQVRPHRFDGENLVEREVGRARLSGARRKASVIQAVQTQPSPHRVRE